MTDHQEERRCWKCSGRGTVTVTTTETDFVMGAALGSAFGTGFFPSTKTVTKDLACDACFGSGKQR